jgi:hypothetical protein
MRNRNYYGSYTDSISHIVVMLLVIIIGIFLRNILWTLLILIPGFLYMSIFNYYGFRIENNILYLRRFIGRTAEVRIEDIVRLEKIKLRIGTVIVHMPGKYYTMDLGEGLADFFIEEVTRIKHQVVSTGQSTELPGGPNSTGDRARLKQGK